MIADGHPMAFAPIDRDEDSEGLRALFGPDPEIPAGALVDAACPHCAHLQEYETRLLLMEARIVEKLRQLPPGVQL